jgi:hypothetical protein
MPIKTANELAEAYELDQVILLGWSKKTGLTHVVTYGKTLEDCKQAADGGNRLKKALGWPDDECKAVPNRVKNALKEES